MKEIIRFDGVLYPIMEIEKGMTCQQLCEQCSDTENNFFCSPFTCKLCGLCEGNDFNEKRLVRLMEYINDMPPVHTAEEEPRDHLQFEYQGPAYVQKSGVYWDMLEIDPEDPRRAGKWLSLRDPDGSGYVYRRQHFEFTELGSSDCPFSREDIPIEFFRCWTVSDNRQPRARTVGELIDQLSKLPKDLQLHAEDEWVKLAVHNIISKNPTLGIN